MKDSPSVQLPLNHRFPDSLHEDDLRRLELLESTNRRAGRPSTSCLDETTDVDEANEEGGRLEEGFREGLSDGFESERDEGEDVSREDADGDQGSHICLSRR